MSHLEPAEPISWYDRISLTSVFSVELAFLNTKPAKLLLKLVDTKSNEIVAEKPIILVQVQVDPNSAAGCAITYCPVRIMTKSR